MSDSRTHVVQFVSRRTLTLAALLAACGDAVSSSDEPDPVTAVEVIAPAASLASGATLQLSVKIRGPDGSELTGRQVVWSSSTPTIATVDPTGLVTASVVRTGQPISVQFTAAVEGRIGAVNVRVDPVPVAVVVLSTDTDTLVVGASRTLTVELRDATALPLTGRVVTWTSRASSVATVDAAGRVTAHAVGTSMIVATAEGVQDSTAIIVPPAPTGELTIANAPVYPLYGDSVLIRWNITHSLSCTSSEAWTGTRPPVGDSWVRLDRFGENRFVLRCVGAGGSVERATSVIARRPVNASSYDNAKRVGVMPTWMPRFNDAMAYGDFLGDGNLGLFTADLIYNPQRPITDAVPGVFRFWRPAPDGVSWLPSTVTVLKDAENCLHPRKSVVADVNRDRRPDIFVFCHGYDNTPYPGERSRLLLSQSDGSYRQREFNPRIAFYHGAAICDLEGDDVLDLITADGNGMKAWRLSTDGSATIDGAHPVSQLVGTYYTVECADVDEDGRLDIVLGGHEPLFGYGDVPTEIWFGRPGNTFSRVTVAAVQGYGTVLDFTVTGTGVDRSLWVLRTTDGHGTAYQGSALQRIRVATNSSSVPRNGGDWFPWIYPYVRGGTSYVGTNALGRGWEYAIVP